MIKERVEIGVDYPFFTVLHHMSGKKAPRVLGLSPEVAVVIIPRDFLSRPPAGLPESP